MTTSRRRQSRRKLDGASFLLTMAGLSSGAVSIWLIAHEHVNPVVAIPSVIAAIVGVAHITKREASR